MSSLYKLYGVFFLQSVDRLIANSSTIATLKWVCHNRSMRTQDYLMFDSCTRHLDIIANLARDTKNPDIQRAASDILVNCCLPFVYLFY